MVRLSKHAVMRDEPNDGSLSRKVILLNSTRVCGACRPIMWISMKPTGGITNTPIEETLEALQYAVKAAKVRYIDVCVAIFESALHGRSATSLSNCV
jgi:hypothetical protein